MICGKERSYFMDYDKLEKCYNIIKNEYPSIESLPVVKTVHDFRQFWKPHQVKVVLLAESHVYTGDSEQKISFDPSSLLLPINYPRYFVRFVYCLGYGENDLLVQSIENNPGTWQYWELLYSCLNDVKNNNWNFSPVLKGGTKNLDQRIRYKIQLLNNLKESGIWLIDASIVGINEGKSSNKKRIIKLCWEYYIHDLIKSINPQEVIIIGETVKSVIEDELDKMPIEWSWRYQPQAQKKSSVHHEAFEHYFKVCNRDSNTHLPLTQKNPPSLPITLKKNNQQSSSKKAKDYTKYQFDGASYNKGQLVLNVLSEYLKINRTTTFKELKNAFPDSIQFLPNSKYGVFQKKEESLKFNKKGKTRFYTKKIDILTSHDNVEIAVCNQWSKDNIIPFLEAAKKHGFKIESE